MDETKKTLEGVKKMLDIIHELPEMQTLYISAAFNCIHQLLHSCEEQLETNLSTSNN